MRRDLRIGEGEESQSLLDESGTIGLRDAAHRIDRERRALPVRRIAKSDRAALTEEGLRLLAFTDPELTHDVRFVAG